VSHASGRRVAITGLRLASSLGHSYLDVVRRLRAGESGVRSVTHWERFRVRSLVAGTLDDIDARLQAAPLTKNLRLAMSDAALYCALSAIDAVRDAGLSEAALRSPRAACIVGHGSGVVSSAVYEAAHMIARDEGRLHPFTAFRCMSSSASASVANLFGILGPSYSIGAACATPAHNIGHAYSLVRSGVADVALAGGGERSERACRRLFRRHAYGAVYPSQRPAGGGVTAIRQVSRRLRAQRRRRDRGPGGVGTRGRARRARAQRDGRLRLDL
jgi:3-oxoacyl-[acyl-carrier-protein] synthase-1